MVGQHAAKLAAGIISSHFGDPVAKVCGCLLQHGTLSLQEIVRFTDMMGSNVKNCLLVLIQHNCVQAFSIPRKGSTDKTVTQYMSIFDNIINRMRFSKFLSVVKDDLALEVCENDETMQFSVMSHDSNCTNPGTTNTTEKKAEVLFEGLIQNGRLTFEQLVERSISKGQHMDQAEKEVLWRVNFEKLLYCLKTKICAENIRSRFGVDAGVVLEAIMEANTEQKIKDAIGTRLQFC